MKRKYLRHKGLVLASAGMAGALLLTSQIPAQAEVQIMLDGSLFDAAWYAQTYPEAAAEVGSTDPSLLYADYLDRSRQSIPISELGTYTDYEPYEKPEYGMTATSEFELRIPFGIQPIANSVVYTVCNTDLYSEPFYDSPSQLLGTYKPDTKLGIDGYAYDLDQYEEIEWLEVVRKDGSKAYVKREDVLPYSAASTNGVTLNTALFDLRPYLGQNLSALEEALSSLGYTMTYTNEYTQHWGLSYDYQHSEDDDTYISVSVTEDDAKIITSFYFNATDVRFDQLCIGQSYLDQYNVIESYGVNSGSPLYVFSSLYYGSGDSTASTANWADGDYYADENSSPVGVSYFSIDYDTNHNSYSIYVSGE